MRLRSKGFARFHTLLNIRCGLLCAASSGTQIPVAAAMTQAASLSDGRQMMSRGLLHWVLTLLVVPFLEDALSLQKYYGLSDILRYVFVLYSPLRLVTFAPGFDVTTSQCSTTMVLAPASASQSAQLCFPSDVSAADLPFSAASRRSSSACSRQ